MRGSHFRRQVDDLNGKSLSWNHKQNQLSLLKKPISQGALRNWKVRSQRPSELGFKLFVTIFSRSCVKFNGAKHSPAASDDGGPFGQKLTFSHIAWHRSWNPIWGPAVRWKSEQMRRSHFRRQVDDLNGESLSWNHRQNQLSLLKKILQQGALRREYVDMRPQLFKLGNDGFA